MGSDRSRVPWPGGSRTFNGGAILAPFVLLHFQWLLGLSDHLICVIPLFILLFAHLLWVHLMCLSLPWRTDYLPSWIACSVCGLYSDYVTFLRPTQDFTIMVAMHVLLCIVALAFFDAMLRQPPTVDLEQTGEQIVVGKFEEEDSAYRIVSLPQPESRVYMCRVCARYIRLRDHHCVWINTCVGSHNHHAFVIFVAGFGLLAFSYSATMCIATAAAQHQDVSTHLFMTLHSGRLTRPLKGVFYAWIGGMCATSLLVGQVRNISVGLTTHERKRLDRAGWTGGADSPQRPHPFDNGGCLANWLAWCRGHKQVSCYENSIAHEA